MKVQKKDGQMEDFDRNKILSGVIKSGATAEEAENVTKQVDAWATTAAVNGVIASIQIKTKLLEILRAVNPTAAAAFEAYQKPAPQPEVPPAGMPGPTGTPGTV